MLVHMSLEGDGELYHSRLWGYDPLFDNKFKLNICDILKLETYSTYKGINRISNHPVIQLWIMGDVINTVTRERYTSYKVDDGSGCIRCVWWHNEGLPPPEIQQGCLVTVIGKLNEYREAKQIFISKIEKSTDPNQELTHWLDTIRLKPLYLSPYIVPDNRKRNLVDKLKKLLHVHLSKRQTSFTLEEMIEEIKSNNLILNMDAHVGDDPVFIDTLIKETMDDMVKDSYFITDRSCSPNHYKYLSNEAVIPTVLEVFRKLNDQPIEVNTLLDILKTDHLHVSIYLTIGRLEQVLTVMVEESMIYPIEEEQCGLWKDRYKLVQ